MVVAGGCGGGTASRNRGRDNGHGTATLHDASGIHWFEDDYERARGVAEARGVPLFVDVGATWCALCVKMDKGVLADHRLAVVSDRAVWLKLDVDTEENRFPFSLFQTRQWPTYLVVDPIKEVELARTSGALSEEGMLSFLHDAFGRFQRGGSYSDDARLYHSFLRRAKRAIFKGHGGDAIAFLKKAKRRLPEGDNATIEKISIIAGVAEAGDYAECVEESRSLLSSRLQAELQLTLLEIGVQCATALSARGAEDAFVDAAIPVASTLWAALSVRDDIDVKNRLLKVQRSLLLLTDDRGAAVERAVVQQALLDTAAAAATVAEDAMRWDSDRCDVYLFLGHPEEMATVLRERIATLPERYEPLANLAHLAARSGDLDEALQCARDAVGIAPDPEIGEVLSLLADIYALRGEKEEEREVRQFLEEYYRTLPPVLSPKSPVSRPYELTRSESRYFAY